MVSERLFYRKIGNGSKSLILFHGFGQNHEIFETWYSELTNDYTIYSFDLYFHGQSLHPDRPLEKAEWKSAFERFLNENKIQIFSMGAFSMGGRFALLTALQFADNVQKLILIAPDGIFSSGWYRTATNPLINPIFKYLMVHPSYFNRLVNLFEKLHLAPRSLIRFAKRELAEKNSRERVYRSWTFFKSILIRNHEMIKTFNSASFPIELILGSKDPIIPPEKVLPKVSQLQSIKPHILPQKHHHLVQASKSLVASFLLNKNL